MSESRIVPPMTQKMNGNVFSGLRIHGEIEFQVRGILLSTSMEVWNWKSCGKENRGREFDREV